MGMSSSATCPAEERQLTMRPCVTLEVRLEGWEPAKVDRSATKKYGRRIPNCSTSVTAKWLRQRLHDAKPDLRLPKDMELYAGASQCKPTDKPLLKLGNDIIVLKEGSKIRGQIGVLSQKTGWLDTKLNFTLRDTIQFLRIDISPKKRETLKCHLQKNVKSFRDDEVDIFLVKQSGVRRNLNSKLQKPLYELGLKNNAILELRAKPAVNQIDDDDASNCSWCVWCCADCGDDNGGDAGDGDFEDEGCTIL